METWRKYEKTYRLKLDGMPAFEKFMLDDTSFKLLLNGNVNVTEKMDGSNSGIFKTKEGQIFLQKRRGNIDKSHHQYKFFENWGYQNIEKLKKLPNNIVVYGELMRCVHSIKYTKLPDWFLVFDIYDLESEEYLDWNEVKRIVEGVGLKTVPLIYEGEVDRKKILSLIPSKSAFGDMAEGIVIKNYDSQLRGKVVKSEFIKIIDEGKHWQTAPIDLNEVEFKSQ